MREFTRPAAAIVKHTNPCGLAVADHLADAFRKAYECDTTSAYGGVVALNRELDAATAEQIAAIFVEVVFNYPGMGLAFYSAALNVDYQVLLGFTLLATLATILGNLLADVGYAVLDPRVRYT